MKDSELCKEYEGLLKDLGKDLDNYKELLKKKRQILRDSANTEYSHCLSKFKSGNYKNRFAYVILSGKKTLVKLRRIKKIFNNIFFVTENIDSRL